MQKPESKRSPPPKRRESLNVIVVDDEATIRGPVGLCLETLGHRVIEASTAEEAIAAVQRENFDVAILDIRLGTADGLQVLTHLLAIQPRLKVIVITAYASVEIAIRAMARGATDFLCKPFTPDQLAGCMAHAGDLCELESTVGFAPDRLGTAAAEADFATTSAELQEAVETARRVAPSRTPLLIAGEAGTGKSVLARAIHGWGERPEGPFFSIDCATRSAAYVDLALFGDSVVGDQVVIAEHPPLVHQCAGGTLMISRVEALSSRLQERLARVINTGEYEAAGNRAKKADFRIIGTTDRSAPLETQLAEAFDAIQLSLPPLRNRADDIGGLAQRYLGYIRRTAGKALLGFQEDALEVLLAYPWPGNLRQLHRVVNEAVQAADGPYVEVKHLPPEVRDYQGSLNRRARAGDAISLGQLEAEHIRAVLARAGSLQAAAETLGLDLQALYRRRKQYGIE